jgi:hypothetical protein
MKRKQLAKRRDDSELETTHPSDQSPDPGWQPRFEPKPKKEDIAEENARKQDFIKYLRNRSLARAKEMKQSSTAVKEREFYDEQAFERWKDKAFGPNFDDHNEEKDDYYEDLEEKYYSGNNSTYRS